MQLREIARGIYPLRFVHGKLWAIKHYSSAMLLRPGAALRFLLTDPELDNYTYEISNHHELAQCLADQFNCDFVLVQRYIDELENNDAFRGQLNRRLSTRRDRKPKAQYGRRAGWYCISRLLKPACIVEAGVHDGLGSSVFLLALERNHSEGTPGKLIGIDIDPTAGWLIPHELRERFQLIVDDSVSALNSLAAGNETIDLFIHDSLHSYDHEAREYQAVRRTLSPRGAILSDNAHSTHALKDFATEHGRRYAFWRERPNDHFYPGGGIGISSPR